MSFGKAHLRHIQHCLRSKANKDLKANDQYAATALRRLRLGRECERIMSMIEERGHLLEPHEVATALGWTPPLIALEPLNIIAQRWLDQRHSEEAIEE
jgi:hypothetical protein